MAIVHPLAEESKPSPTQEVKKSLWRIKRVKSRSSRNFVTQKSSFFSADRKRGQRKGATSKNIKNRQKVSKIFSTLFDIFRAGQKTSKIVKKCQKKDFLDTFRQFFFRAGHQFSGPFGGALIFDSGYSLWGSAGTLVATIHVIRVKVCQAGAFPRKEVHLQSSVSFTSLWSSVSCFQGTRLGGCTLQKKRSTPF